MSTRNQAEIRTLELARTAWHHGQNWLNSWGQNCQASIKALPKRVRYLARAAWLQRHNFLTSIEALRKLVGNIGTIALIAIGAMLIGKAALVSENIIEPIIIPDELAKKGYTREIIAMRIIDEIKKITHAEKTSRGLAAFSAIESDHPCPKIDLPVVGMSPEGLLTSLHILIGRPDTKITGEITLPAYLPS
jgi:hypothetical protein